MKIKTMPTNVAISLPTARMSHWSPVAAMLRLALLAQALPLLWEIVATCGGPKFKVSAAAIGREIAVYWNVSNPIFKPSGENVLYVNNLDRINFICPNNGHEYYNVYWTTSRDQYLACSGGNHLLNCRTRDSYLVIVQIFSADPTVPVFLTPVYFYTPSTGDLLGLDQTSGGACKTRNMRISIRTDPPDPTTDPAQDSTSTRALSSPSNPVASTSRTSLTSGQERPRESTTTTTAAAADGGAATMAVTTGRNRRPDSEHPDYSRMSNLITGCGVTMPTVTTVIGLTCLSILLQLSNERLA